RGVGLGLSIVERIARVLHCELTLKSKIGNGSCFAVEVPRAAAAQALKSTPLSRLEAGRLDGMVVLCIDNERAVLSGMETLLNGWGCRVLKGADLVQAGAAVGANGTGAGGGLVGIPPVR